VVVKIRVLSDLHLEFFGSGWRSFVNGLSADDCDVLVLAGDVTVANGTPTLSEALGAFCKRFKRVVFVLGNHEFYGDTPRQVVADMQRVVDRFSAGKCADRFTWLDCSDVVIDGIRFAGASLWFPPDRHAPTHMLNDFHSIREFVPWVYDENRRAVDYLESVAGKVDVVVTHHLPSERSVHPKYAGSPLNAFFVGGAGHILRRCGAQLWIHGHTHESVDYVDVDCNTGRGTRVVCNPSGYFQHEVNTAFDEKKTCEVEST
jgi:predicted phosphodiesterase